MHFYNTYILATGQFNDNFKSDLENHNMKKMVFVGPENFLNLNGADYGYEGKILSPLEKDPNWQEQLDSYNISNGSTRHLVRTQYPPLNWIFQAIGLKIGMLLHQSPFHAWQMARVANFCGFITIMILAIVIIPRGKWVLTAVGIFPISVFLASSMSGDAINISISALLVAYIMHLRFSSQQYQIIKLSQIIKLMGLVLIIFNLKVAYVPMLVIIFLIPNKFYSLKKKIISVGIASLLGLLMYWLWSSKFGTVLLGFADLPQNILFVKEHLITALFSVIIFTLNIPFYFIAGLSTGGAVGVLGFITIIFAILLIIQTISVNYQSININVSKLSERIMLYLPIMLGLLAFLGVMMLTSFALLTTWTKVYPGGVGKTFGMTDIQGLQARYLVPLMPLIALIYGVSKDFIVTAKNSISEN
ncbi:Predicted membrane protein [Leuconostocaceae bacterium R-53105]|uniref:Putative membrane protein DUF2142 n=2 Tax=Convivina intestini TaxID=1505726 RepID=A0A2U1DCA4_9LACO|nr:putative membrane protein DUF2142 [Convivina intestini]CAH1852757.1 hypothetical protein R077811_00505 [Convivina intestini]SDB86710.1 Predicted membrane protein [Leuconostocaceae bacterium R-53105]